MEGHVSASSELRQQANTTYSLYMHNIQYVTQSGFLFYNQTLTPTKNHQVLQ